MDKPLIYIALFCISAVFLIGGLGIPFFPFVILGAIMFISSAIWMAFDTMNKKGFTDKDVLVWLTIIVTVILGYVVVKALLGVA